MQPPPPPSNQDIFLLLDNVNQSGPYTLSQVMRMISSGDITPYTLAWRDGMDDWGLIEDVIRRESFQEIHKTKPKPEPPEEETPYLERVRVKMEDSGAGEPTAPISQPAPVQYSLSIDGAGEPTAPISQPEPEPNQYPALKKDWVEDEDYSHLAYYVVAVFMLFFAFMANVNGSAEFAWVLVFIAVVIGMFGAVTQSAPKIKKEAKVKAAPIAYSGNYGMNPQIEQPTARLSKYLREPDLVPVSLGAFLKFMFLIGLALYLIQLFFMAQMHYADLDTEAKRYYDLLISFWRWGMLSKMVSGVIFFVWIYKMNKNCHTFGAQDMKFTPGWAVGYWFIPFLNLFRPYQSMKEIWNASENPSDHKGRKGNFLIKIWWTTFILSLLFDRISTATTVYNDFVILFTISTVFHLASIISIIVIVFTITNGGANFFL